MTAQERWQLENYAIACPLTQIDDPDMMAFVATLIQDHDHLREKLMSESDPSKRRWKLGAMKSYLRFEPKSVDDYELAEVARKNGVQPIYQEQADLDRRRIWMPPSFVHEVPR